ncbi:MAG TPA: archease [Candidatus Limnocylindrales bacterium]|nr:archease [Candidatus Limnocylindrales bacterium]
MPYKYLEEIAIADIAFEAWGSTPEELFKAAADATMNVMVADLSTIADGEKRRIELEEENLDLLLFNFLQELIYYKDAQRLLLRIDNIHIEKTQKGFKLRAEAYGEELNPEKHDLRVDVKAVTLHQFQVKKTSEGWWAQVILDI